MATVTARQIDVARAAGYMLVLNGNTWRIVAPCGSLVCTLGPACGISQAWLNAYNHFMGL